MVLIQFTLDISIKIIVAIIHFESY